MTRIEKSALINASVEQVYTYALQIPKITEWWSSMASVRNFTQETAAPGVKYEWTYKMMGIHFDGKTEVIEVASNRRIVTRSEGGIPSTIEQTFEDAGGDKTRFTMRIDYTVPGKFFGAIADKLFVERFNEREADHVVGNLKAICEAAATVATAK